MRTLKLLSACTVLSLIFGCSQKPTVTQPTPPSTQNGKMAIPHAIFLADNQHVDDYGQKIFEQSELVSWKVPTARRSALNNLFNLDIFPLIDDLENTEGNTNSAPMFILGDVLNNSCESEMKEFLNAMGKVGRPWYLSPGNHDAYYLGISYPASYSAGALGSLNERNGWSALCKPWREMDRNAKSLPISERESFVHDKREFIQHYLKALAARSAIKSSDFSDIGMTCINGTDEYLQELCWYSADSNKSHVTRQVWKDFIIHNIELGDQGEELKYRVILADTVSSDKKPVKQLTQLQALFSFPLRGGFTALQRKQLEKWLKRNHESGYSNILAGHHPMKSLNGDTQKWMYKMAEKGLIDNYVSAHTHAGFTKIHKKGRSALKEINIGSLVDAPVEYARFQDKGVFHHIFLHEKDSLESSLWKRRLNGINDVDTTFNNQICDIQFNNQSLDMLAAELHKGSNKSKRVSMVKEAQTYLELLQAGVIDIKQTDIEPVCYRQNNRRCDGPSARIKGMYEGEGACAGYSSVEVCKAEKATDYINLGVLQNKNDFIEVLTGISKQEARIGESIGKNIYHIFASRQLDAARKFLVQNAVPDTMESTRVKACLSIQGTVLKGL